MAASTTPDRDLNEAAFHSKYGFMAGWDAARDSVYSAMKNQKDEATRKLLRDLWESMGSDERDPKRDAFVAVLDQ